MAKPSGQTQKGIYNIAQNSVTDQVKLRPSSSRDALAHVVGYSPTTSAAVSRQTKARAAREASLRVPTKKQTKESMQKELGFTSKQGYKGAPQNTATTLASVVATLMKSLRARQQFDPTDSDSRSA